MNCCEFNSKIWQKNFLWKLWSLVTLSPGDGVDQSGESWRGSDTKTKEKKRRNGVGQGTSDRSQVRNALWIFYLLVSPPYSRSRLLSLWWPSSVCTRTMGREGPLEGARMCKKKTKSRHPPPLFTIHVCLLLSLSLSPPPSMYRRGWNDILPVNGPVHSLAQRHKPQRLKSTCCC